MPETNACKNLHQASAFSLSEDGIHGKRGHDDDRSVPGLEIGRAQQMNGLIPAELTALTSRSEIDPFIPPEQLEQLNAEVDKLANGVFDDKAKAFIGDRRRPLRIRRKE